jgi:hypothetical protein
MDMIELLFPSEFDTLKVYWVNAKIGIYTLTNYFVTKERQQHPCIKSTAWRKNITYIEHSYA